MPKPARTRAPRVAKPKLDPRAEALRDRVLKGAASAFGRLGYADTRVEDVVADAGVSRPTFYKFWRSKDDVLAALSERHHAAIRDRLTQAVESTDDPLLQLERSIESFLRWRAELGPVGRVLDLEARAPGTRLTTHRKPTLDYIAELIRRAVVRAGGAPIDPLLVRALVAASEHVADELASGPTPSERALQHAKAILLSVYLGALARPRPATTKSVLTRM